MQIGPLGSSISTIGGENYRDEIYSWPLSDPCRIDQHIASESWTSDEFYEVNTVYSYGLDALEYVLFSDSSSACSDDDPLISEGVWASLDSDTIQQRRIQFALHMSRNLQSRTETLIHTWSPEGEDFSGKLAQNDAPYGSPQEALNEIYNALFYLETMTKDKKLAQPLGIKDCSQSNCLDDINTTVQFIFCFL